MFSLSLEYLKRELDQPINVFSRSKKPSSTKLTLPLERTALEQINYTKWYYSEDSKKTLRMIKDSHLTSSNNGLLKLNYQENSFVLANPLPGKSDEFYFLFDYLKDKMVKKGFEVKDSVQEAISNGANYIEIEIFYLYNSTTKQYITLEIRSFKGSPLNITGQCTYTNETTKTLSNSKFFECVKDIFSI